MLSDFISILYPETCLNCSQTLISSENFICTSCKTDLPKTNDFLHKENELYQKFAYEPIIDSVSAFLYFNKGGITQKLLHRLKYEDKSEIGNLLGQWYGSDIAGSLRPDIILPVPIHKSKMRRRGYNQSEGFAYGLSEQLDNSVVRDDLIFRVKRTATQTKKSKVARWLNVDNIYSDSTEDLSGKSIMVVDDVITTGATVGMLCEKIKKANASSIQIACIARG